MILGAKKQGNTESPRARYNKLADSVRTIFATGQIVATFGECYASTERGTHSVLFVLFAERLNRNRFQGEQPPAAMEIFDTGSNGNTTHGYGPSERRLYVGPVDASGSSDQGEIQLESKNRRNRVALRFSHATLNRAVPPDHPRISMTCQKRLFLPAAPRVVGGRNPRASPSSTGGYGNEEACSTGSRNPLGMF